MLRVRFSEPAKQLIVPDGQIKNYYELSDKQAISIFLPPDKTYTIVDESEPADICIVGIQHTEHNVFLSVENFSVGRTHYQHWNRFGRNGNPLIHTYI